ncbi:MAG: OmpA family protein [Gemmatimonadales bacterium]
MRRSVTTSLIFLLSIGNAAVAAAQSGTSTSGVVREIGVFASGRILSTEYSVADGRTAFGGAATFGSFVNSMFAVQGGLAVNYGRQEYSYYKPPLITYTPTISLLVGPTEGDFQPYALVGAGYEFVKYTHPRCDCAQTKSLGIANVGAGIRKMISDNKAIRAEFSSQIGKGGPAFTVLAGMSFLIGRQSNTTRPDIHPTMRPPSRVRPEPPVQVLPKTGTKVTPGSRPSTPITTPPAEPPRVVRNPAPSTLPKGVGSTLLSVDGTQVDFTKPTWRDEIETLLDGLVADLTSDAGINVKISIEAHTDNIGSNAANIMLGLDRARAVREYLVTQGITADRVRISSAGEDAPLTTNTTALGRQQNRRIIIKRDN